MRARALAIGALVAAVLVTALAVLPDGGYTIRARFEHAGQLVEGGRVTVAGRKVGSIESIAVAANGQAEVALSIADGALTPLHHGTRATIRAVGQAGLSNRYVDLSPGPERAQELADGALLPTTQTQGIVNLDALLSSFGPAQRARFRDLVEHGASIYAGSGAQDLRSMLGKAPAAFADLDGLFGELAQDALAVRELIAAAERATTALAARPDDLAGAVEHTARALGAVASERAALAEVLDRAPAALGQAEETLAGADDAVRALRPALRAVPEAGRPLASVLPRLTTFLAAAEPVVEDLTDQLPSLRTGLDGLPRLQGPAVRGLASLGGSMRAAAPILTTLRLYGSDLIIGALTAIGGLATGPYDANGHYAKVNFVQSLQTLPGGPLAEALSQDPLVPGLLHTRTKLERRCPGGNVPPAADGSSPWLIGEEYCDPADNTPASVNGG